MYRNLEMRARSSCARRDAVGGHRALELGRCVLRVGVGVGVVVAGNAVSGSIGGSRRDKESRQDQWECCYWAIDYLVVALL